MSKNLSGMISVYTLTAFLFMLSSCSHPDSVVNESTATRKSIGRWHLSGIKSGWTNIMSTPAKKVVLVIDEQRQSIVFEDGKETVRFQYILTETNPGILRYSIHQQSGTSTLFYPPTHGNFRVSSKQLIIGDTGVDGNDYFFAKQY